MCPFHAIGFLIRLLKQSVTWKYISSKGFQLATMISTLQDFEEGTAFELYVLERVRPAIEQHGGASIDLRDSKTVAAVGVFVSESVSGAALHALKDELAPLMFGAAWKVLDLLLEFALNRAGLTPAHNDWSIAEKQKHALNGRGDRDVLRCSQPVWEALLRVYANTVEHRHCLIHRTAKVDAGTGTMAGVDRNQIPLRPLTRGHQFALAKLASIAARGVLGGGIERRAEDHLKYQLDQLAIHTGSPPFGVSEASVPVDVHARGNQRGFESRRRLPLLRTSTFSWPSGVL
jgi:hypothetical protein